MNVRQVLVLSSIVASAFAVAPATAAVTAVATTTTAKAATKSADSGILTATKRPDFCKYWPFLPLCK